jgi:glycosyltransferase involved in cell wall biosynthesis
MSHMVSIAIIAHEVSVPLYTHRSKEFSNRIYFLAKHYDEIHIFSHEKKIQFIEKEPLVDEREPNIFIHRFSNNIFFSNITLLNLFKQINADVIFADTVDDGMRALLTRRHYSIPLVTFVQGYEADLKAIIVKRKLRMEPQPGMLSKIFALEDKILLKSSDKILCVSPGLVEYVKGLLPKTQWSKIEFIPHSLQYVKEIPKEAYNWADNFIDSINTTASQQPVLITVVGSGLTKGTDIAIHTHKYIVEKYPNSYMLIIGKHIDPKYIEMAQKIGIQEKVLFLENLPREKVLALLSRSTIFLSPSFSEGFSWAVAEAMALGVPVVTYANKSIGSAQKGGAVIAVETTDPKVYAEKCISLIKDEKKRLQLVERAKAYVEPLINFSEYQRLELIRKVIDSVLKR